MILLDVALAPATGQLLSAGAIESGVAFLSTALVAMGLSDITSGITDRFSGEDNEGEDTSDGHDISDDGGFGGDFMDGDGAGDDLDDLDGWDDDEGEDFDDLGGAADSGTDLEPRMKELENEIASISSTMGTVRSENEAINETVDDIEDNVRKLLEIYEMVTRGVNPFADEVEGSAGGGGAFGLFGGGEADGGGADELDSDIAEADADSFFDDDWEDDAVDDDGFDDADFEDEAAAGSDDADDGESGKTFDQLKSEYEEGDEEWSDGENDDGSDEVESSSREEDDESRADNETAPVGDPGPAGEGGTGSAAREPSTETGAASNGTDDKPYLLALPDGYGTDLLVIEWLSYLRDNSDTAEALRAIRYYETIGWLGRRAAEALAEFMTGLGDGEKAPGPGGGTQLTVDHHTNSLRYIGRLSGTDVQIERLEWAGASRRSPRIEGGEQRGIQR